MENRTRLYFAGIKHSGKTTFASRIARRLGLQFRDSDDLLMDWLSISDIRAYYKSEGKEAFMQNEYMALASYIASADGFVISLGGGASDNTRLISLMKDTGQIVYLRRNEDEMLPVILSHGIPAFLDESDIRGSFHRIFTERDAIYSGIADLTIDAGPYRDKDDTEQFILSRLLEAGYGCK